MRVCTWCLRSGEAVCAFRVCSRVLFLFAASCNYFLDDRIDASPSAARRLPPRTLSSHRAAALVAEREKLADARESFTHHGRDSPGAPQALAVAERGGRASGPNTWGRGPGISPRESSLRATQAQRRSRLCRPVTQAQLLASSLRCALAAQPSRSVNRPGSIVAIAI